ncbi:hypothetical protein [Paenibacillus flagellatus]|uniref:Uncharacterized protein n=1 Tax=Paenibacillus flagellatus TaxID=2211139 RepID=A0A2V5KQ63_9BACL|nr:hypothetical protein [Paenibacillus flagellatus]PYI53397.1 hypothetical protein DLM86_16595 [Paenibacillus flagellatus]
MSGYPPEIEQFHQTLCKLAGVESAISGVDDLSSVDAELLAATEYAHLPHAALLRTGGGLDNEVLIQFELVLQPSQEGWHALEFLGWFVRDCARGGRKIQLRPFALPPVTPYGGQLGHTLKFHLDLFVDGIEDSLAPALQVVSEINRSLELAISLYKMNQAQQ